MLVRMKSKLKNSGYLILFIILMIVSVIGVAGESIKPSAGSKLIQNALELERNGKTEEALREYINWLDSATIKNENDLDLALSSIMKLDRNLSEIVSIVEKNCYLDSSILNLSKRAYFLKNTAALLEMVGNFPKAKEFYEKAWTIYRNVENFDSLIGLSETMYSMGLFLDSLQILNENKTLLSSVTTQNQLRYYLIAGFVNLQAGNHTEAIDNFRAIIDKTFKDSIYFINANIGMFFAFRGIGDLERATQYSKYLSSIKISPTPNLLTITSFPYYNNSIDTKNNTSKNITIRKQELKKGNYIQIGSFGVKENALYLIESLKKQDFFKPFLIRAQVKDRTLYRVLIGPFNTIEDAQNVIKKLKSSGFDGIIKSY